MTEPDRDEVGLTVPPAGEIDPEELNEGLIRGFLRPSRPRMPAAVARPLIPCTLPISPT
ncbi:MAG: hypothetical protein R3D60_04160 [Paracoccaceae bacterium]